MVEVTDRWTHGFTREQFDFLQKTFAYKSEPGFARQTQTWLFAGIVVLGIAATGFLWTEIGSVRGELRTEIGSVRTEISSVKHELQTEISSVGDEVHENRTAILELVKGQSRIEAILEERLPRSE